MHLYKLNPTQAFLPTLADFIINNFAGKFEQLKVILPTGYACLNLQRILVEKKGVAILPNIIPFSDVTAESEEIFKIPSENIEAISFLEERIILAEIIHSYKNLNFSLAQSLKFSSLLAKLFDEFTNNDLELEALNNLNTHSSAEHWQFIYEFLKSAKASSSQRIADLNKSERGIWRKLMLAAEIERIKNNSNLLLVAGIWGHDKTSWEFLSSAAKEGAHIILPPLPECNRTIIDRSLRAEGDGLYCLKKLLSYLNKNLADFKSLDSAIYTPTILDQIITGVPILSNAHATPPNPGSQYIEFEDIFEEAEHIGVTCKQAIAKNPDIKIALILNNTRTKEFYCNFLAKYGVENCDLLGCDLRKLNICNLILAVSEIVCGDFEIKKLFILLKNPLINSSHIAELEKLLQGMNRFTSSWQKLEPLVKKTGDKEFVLWFAKLQKSLNVNSLKRNFNNTLRSIIEVSEKLCPDIWYMAGAAKISALFTELINLNWQVELKDKLEFPEVLREMISGAQFFNNDTDAVNVTIGSLEDLALLKFDLVILADFSEGNWPRSHAPSPWLNRQMQEELELYSEQIGSSRSLYNFYLLLFNQQVLLTRSKKQGGSSNLAESSYLLKLQFILGKGGNVMPNYSNAIPSNPNVVPAKPGDHLNNFMDFSLRGKDMLSLNSNFPTTISATDIEMLVRSPYSFYAKKILKLRQQESLTAPPKLSEFGNFVHSVIDQYSKAYDKSLKNKLKYLLSLSHQFLEKNVFSKITKNTWQIKFDQLAPEFIEFDEGRRELSQVYSEVRGSMNMDIAGQRVQIIAIADRIEIDREGQAIILDYKTGTIPTKKDVTQGLSPQLIIEALIMAEGGFGINANQVHKIVYVKVGSSSPYIKLTEIELTPAELEDHRLGIQSLLEYYIMNKNYPKEVDLLKYNDYKHLARRL